MEGLVEGRVVHYVAYNGRHLAGMVIGLNDTAEIINPSVDLVVFTNMPNVNGKKNYGMQFHTDVSYSENKESGTWHWIERA